MEKVTLKEFKVKGQSVVTDNKTEFSGSGEIPRLWKEFFVRHRVIDNKIYGVYNEFKGNVDDEYKLTVGFKESDSFKYISEKDALFGDNDSLVTIESGDYLVFEVEGQMPEAIIRAWHDVWTHFNEDREYVRVFKSDFEEYESDKKARIYIGISNK